MLVTNAAEEVKAGHMSSQTGNPHGAVKRQVQVQDAKLRIGEMLIDAGLITHDQLEKALELQRARGGKTVENLIALQYIDAHTFLRFLSRQPGIASIDLLNYTIPRELIEMVPAEFALKHEVIPLDRMGRDLTVGMACPLDASAINELETATGLRVRPLLVSMNDVRVALKRYYTKPEAPSLPEHRVPQSAAPAVAAAPPLPLPTETLPKIEAALNLEGIMHLVRNIKALPALPETVSRVRATMENAAASASDIAAIIEHDPSISAKMLSLANSSAYGFAHKVPNVTKAVTLLGLRETYSIVLTSAVIDYFEASKHFDYKNYWRWSMFCATAARTIAAASGYQDRANAYTAGLLHDLGRLVFAEVVPERYSAIDQRLPDAEVMALEERMFGVAHPELGYLLAREWNLPGDIMTAMRFHHQPIQADACHELVTITALAAVMTDAYGRITRENAAQFAAQCKDLLSMLHLTEKDFIQVLAETARAAKEQFV